MQKLYKYLKKEHDWITTLDIRKEIKEKVFEDSEIYKEIARLMKENKTLVNECTKLNKESGYKSFKITGLMILLAMTFLLGAYGWLCKFGIEIF